MQRIEEFSSQITLSESIVKELERLGENVLELIRDEVDEVLDQPFGVQMGMLGAAVIGAALGFFVIRFGLAMNNLEQRVSDMQDRLDGAGNA